MTQSKDKAGAPSRRRVLKATAAVATGLAAPTFLRIGSALAAYPDRPIKIVVANTPGGPSDIIARILAAEMAAPLGASVFVENKGGAGGNIGMGYAARAEPDGYTILLTTSAFVVNPGLYNSLPYDPFKDFVAICEPAVNPHVFTVKADNPAKTMKEFIAQAKANPDKYNISTPPIGTTPQLQAEVLKLREGLQKMASVQGRRRRDQGAAHRRGADFLRHAARRSPWPAPSGAGADRAVPWSAAERADHGRGRLQGFRVRYLLRADCAGQGAAGDHRQAGKDRACHPGQAGDEKKADRRWL
jgi:hypothetical protein